ncbi:electron transport complex subunit RsxC [Kosmotoga pacifica]|uniref:Ion-translocating oxidoreductase complex subunit C n=1 Tax=Kosmotoga pacifica TaxID=1330330 RepID=A0A0G2ZB19_9BACT|nr:electron transport complex subunit RsxC [Kosmotoga pacifica]AKI97301.1 electron transporter RnfC [Kosmotoga pacifica]
MGLLTFRGGVHPPEKKELSEHSALTNAPLPEVVYVFLANHAGVPAKPLVEPGQHVLTGQKIGEAAGFISANLHSPVTGVVKGIEKIYHPVLGKPDSAIVIEREGEDTWQLLEPRKPYEEFEPQEIVERIKEAGIVGLGGAMFPTNVKLSPPKEKKIDLLIINGAECEPYLTVDYRMMLEKSQEIVRGVLALIKALGVKKAIIGIENNKPKAIEEIKKATKGTGIEVATLKTKYPQGAEKQLIYAITKRVVPSGGLPMDVGVVVQNVGTAFAVYEALEEGKPLIERAITVTGEAVREPINVIARIGTLASKLIELTGGIKEDEVDRVIFGGPMMGTAVPRVDIPIVKGTSGITVMSKEVAPSRESYPCIRCGSCVKACPMYLQPFVLNLYATNRLYDKAVENGLMDCMECGSCSYACPANIELVKNFKLAKKVYRTLKGGKR